MSAAGNTRCFILQHFCGAGMRSAQCGKRAADSTSQHYQQQHKEEDVAIDDSIEDDWEGVRRDEVGETARHPCGEHERESPSLQGSHHVYRDPLPHDLDASGPVRPATCDFAAP